MQQDADQGRARGDAHLVDEELARAQDLVDDGPIMDDTILHDLLELLLRDTKCRLDLLERIHEVVPVHAHVLDVVRDARERADLDVPAERETRRAFDEAADLGPGEVLRERGELENVDAGVHYPVRAHLCGVDLQDLDTAFLVGEGDLHVHFETARTEEGLVYHVETVSHTDDKDVIQLVDTIHLCIGR